ncbi:MAG: enoyl-CoA hydratase/isomerase family protein [Ktedonobacteraceae bacterium]
MQQAYRVLRIVSEAQTIRMVLMPNPDELMLKELRTACTALNTESSSGIKAVVLDFKVGTEATTATQGIIAQEVIDAACRAVREVEAPVLVVVRGTLAGAANTLISAADLSLVAHDALITIADAHRQTGNGPYTGEQALRLGLINWSVPASNIDGEMARILDMLREQSAMALRLSKASVRLAAHTQAAGSKGDVPPHLAALKQVNEFYLARVMQTADAAEGLQAFLEKRKPQWKNR